MVNNADRLAGGDGWDSLSLTELAAAKFLCDGLDVAATATRLGLTAELAAALVENLYAKLHVSSRVELVVKAVMREGWR